MKELQKYNKIIALCGFSGCGKDTIAKELKDLGFNFITSHSTRPPREGESEGNPYYFISNETFELEDKLNNWIEYRTYNTLVDGIPKTWYYGVHKNEVKNTPAVVVLDLLGLKDFKEQFGDKVLSIFVHVEDSERERRVKSRGSFCQVEWDRRLKDDTKIFTNQELKGNIDYYVSNEDSVANTMWILFDILHLDTFSTRNNMYREDTLLTENEFNIKELEYKSLESVFSTLKEIYNVCGE